MSSTIKVKHTHSNVFDVLALGSAPMMLWRTCAMLYKVDVQTLLDQRTAHRDVEGILMQQETGGNKCRCLIDHASSKSVAFMS